MFFILMAVIAVVSLHAYVTYSKSGNLPSADGEQFLKPDIKAFLFYGFIRSFFSSVVLFGILFIGTKLLIAFIGNDIPEAKSFVLSANYLWIILSLCAL